MSQKINPINFRLGATQVWNTSFQIYGKSNSLYSNSFYLNFFVFQVTAFLHKWTNFLLTDYYLIILKNKVIINFFYPSELLNVPQNTEYLSSIFSNWYNSVIILNGYPKDQWFSSLGLIINYAKHLLTCNVNKSKVLFDLCSFFKNRLGHKKIIESSQGLALVEFVGFKVSLKGRVDNVGNQLSKSISYKVGVLPLTSTKTFVEFSNSTIYTNLGNCEFRIWLFYKI